MLKKIIRAAVDSVRSYNVVAGDRKRADGVINGRSARCRGKCGNAALKSSYSLFKYVLSGVCKSAVNIAGVLKSETSLGLVGIFKNIRCCLIYRNGSCARCYIGLLLTYVEL